MPADQRTEEPTRKRIDEARKKGNVSFSRELTSFILLLNLIIALSLVIPHAINNIIDMLRNILTFSHEFHFTSLNTKRLLFSIILVLLKCIIIPLLLFFSSGIISGIAQNGFLITYEPITPKLERISPIQGLKRIFSLKSIVELFFNLLKTIGIITAIYVSIFSEISKTNIIHTLSFQSICTIMYKYILKILYIVSIVIFFIAIFDIIYKRYSYIKSLRMTKQEIKEEFKNTEVRPEIKSRLRKMRQSIAKRNMMKEVSKADVVITNPTHLAIALLYDADNMPSPKVIAKGKGYIAEKIKKVAIKNDIPIIENKPVAQALFDSVEIDMYIPEQHYKAVAEIISYIYKIKNKKL